MNILRAMRRVVRALGCLGILGGAPLAAQSVGGPAVRGTVVMADGASPVPGVIVIIEARPGEVVARALTDDRGAFQVRLDAGGRLHLRALRIGYQPTTTDITVASAGVTVVRVVLGGTVVTLPSVAVRGEDVCRGDRGEGAVVAAVWEEARKALLASALSTADPLMAEWIEYERTMDTSARVVREQRVRSTRTETTHAFRSAPASQLAESGYVVDTPEGTVFHAPDAEVLLSDGFAAAHCFHTEPSPPGQPSLIGVGFRPARDRRGMSDIEGTFWIDRASRELTSLEYRYTNLPAVTERVRPGGTVEFLRLPSGTWLVRRWAIRMPQLVSVVPSTLRRRGITIRGTPTSVTAVRVVGGEVSRVERRDSLVYEADGAALDVQVHAPDAHTHTSDVRVTLDGTDYALLTDRAGRGRLAPVLAGSYRVRALTPLMDSLGIMPDAVDVSVRPGERRTHTLTLPDARSLLSRLCGPARAEGSGVHVRGVVVDADGLPVEDATVRLSWQQQIGVVADRLVWNEQSATTRSDSLGLWQLCDLPREVGVRVQVRRDTLRGESVLRIPNTALFASSHVALRPVASTRTSAGADAVGIAAAGDRVVDRAVGDRLAASLVISVMDSAQRPVPDAQVVLTVGGVRGRQRRTDDSGRVTVPSVAVGAVTMDIRKVGFASGIVSAEVEPGENTMPVVLQRALVPELSAVRVVGDRRVNARHDEFEQRHAAGDATASITAEEISRRNPVSTWQLLTRVPSLLVLDSAGSIYARSSRMSNIVCWPRVAIDGKILMGIPDLAQLPTPSEIFGIEVFAGGASTPLKYGGEGDGRYCGLIAIWTR